MVRKTSVPRRSTGGCTELRVPTTETDTVMPQAEAASDLDDVYSGSSEGSDHSSGDEDIAQLATQTFQQMKTCLYGSKSQARHVRKRKHVNSTAAIGFVVDKRPDTATVNAEEPQSSTTGSTVPCTSPTSVDSTLKKRKKKRRTGKKDKTTHRGGSFHLSSALQVGIDTSDTYLNVDSYEKPKRQHSKVEETLVKPKADKLMASSVLTPDIEKKDTLPPYEVSLNQQRKQRQADRDKTKGKGWFHLPATELTDEKKNDLLVLQYRRALDPKRFYKAPDIQAVPKYFQMGTVVDNPVDFYHSRIPKKQRKKTLVDELMDDAEFRKFNKRKYAEIQETKRKGRGAHKHMKRLKKKK